MSVFVVVTDGDSVPSPSVVVVASLSPDDRTHAQRSLRNEIAAVQPDGEYIYETGRSLSMSSIVRINSINRRVGFTEMERKMCWYAVNNTIVYVDLAWPWLLLLLLKQTGSSNW